MDGSSKRGVSLNVSEWTKERSMSSSGEFEVLAKNLVYGLGLGRETELESGV